MSELGTLTHSEEMILECLTLTVRVIFKRQLGAVSNTELLSQKMPGEGEPTIRATKDYKDGDDTASSGIVYEYGVHTLISTKSRVYRGGRFWTDRAYWLSPGAQI